MVGCARSGTSLLRDLLRSHSRISIPPESHVLPRLFRTHGDPPDAKAARRLADRLVADVAVAWWRFDGVRPEDLEQHRSFAGMVGELYAAWARSEGKPRWGDKTPTYVAQLPVMRRVFPDAQVIHIIRDPRAVSASLARQSWGPRAIRTAAAQWREAVMAGRRDGPEAGPSSYTEVRYERLVSDPAQTMRELSAFLGEDFEDAMVEANRIPWVEEYNPGRPSQVVAPPPPEQVLGPRDAAIVAWEAGELMAQLGYAYTGPRLGPRPGETGWRIFMEQVTRVRRRRVAMRRGRTARGVPR